MKLLFSSLLFSLAASSEQEGRELANPESATALHARWDMSEPKINYLPDDDKFTFTFMTASEDNNNQGLAESFWDPDCMPVDAGNGVPIGTPLIHRVDDENQLPFFTMQDVTLDPEPATGPKTGSRPRMEFKINPAKFASEGGSTVYSGTKPSCDTPGIKHSLLLNNMQCLTDVLLLEDISGLSEDDCSKECGRNQDCTQFSFKEDSCIGCSGTADELVPSSVDGLNTYEMCDPPELNVATGSCTDTSTVVNLGKGDVSCRNGVGVHNQLFDYANVGSIDECYELCAFHPECERFSYRDNAKDCAGCLAPVTVDATNPPTPFSFFEVDFSNSDSVATKVQDNSGSIETDLDGNMALRFDACGERAYLPVNINPSAMPEVTLVLGVKLASYDAGNKGAVLTTDNAGYDRAISLHYEATGGMGLFTGSQHYTDSVWGDDKPNNAPIDQWMHLVAVYSQTGSGEDNFGRFYFNGEQAPIEVVVNNDDGMERIELGTSQMWNCAVAGNTVWADSWIKEVKVYNSVLSTSQVKALNTEFQNSLTVAPDQESETYAMCPPPPTPNTGANARIDFCVRSSLGYTISTGPASIATPNPVTGTTTESNYQEVNFIETLVRIEYDMSSGFEVASFSVAPKNRELTTISESYEDALIAYLCDTSPGKVDFYDFDSDESYPKARPGTADPFNQGALITVCVRVKEEFASQNIVLKELTDFSWTRSGGSTFNRAIGGGDDATTITQVAITGSEAAGNYLTSYNKDHCSNAYWCNFASVLFAQFYNTPGSVSGTGDAILQFRETRNRRLGGVDERSLQGDPGSAGMDISIDVNGVAEGPGVLKTASGPSFGATTVSVSVVTALIGAVLLA